jgi:oxalate decarboxylase/phosphoglucose isomerase-like protein (cupin superfamily)
MPGYLGHDVRGRPEPVQPDSIGVAGHPEGAVADQSGTEERRGLEVVIARGNREAEALVRNRPLRIASVELVAGEAGAVAQVLTA